MSIDNYQHSRATASTDLSTGLLLEEHPPRQQELASPASSEKKAARGPSKHARLVSLDMVRGLTMAIMILVDEIGGVYPHINHSPWNAITLADFVMPWFLFMVGTSMAFSFRKFLKTDNDGHRKRKLQCEGTKKVIIRAVKLYILGVILQGGDWIDSGANDPKKYDYTWGWNLTTIRFCGILNRIAWAYLVVGLVELWLPTIKPCGGKMCQSPHIKVFVRHAWQWAVGFAMLILYLILTFATYVPSWVSLYGRNSTNVTIQCDTWGQINTPECSAASYWDRTLLGQIHLGEWMSVRMAECSNCTPGNCPKPGAPSWCFAYMYDPEGLLASIPTVLTTVLGMHFGRVLKVCPRAVTDHHCVCVRVDSLLFVFTGERHWRRT